MRQTGLRHAMAEASLVVVVVLVVTALAGAVVLAPAVACAQDGGASVVSDMDTVGTGKATSVNATPNLRPLAGSRNSLGLNCGIDFDATADRGEG